MLRMSYPVYTNNAIMQCGCRLWWMWCSGNVFYSPFSICEGFRLYKKCWQKCYDRVVYENNGTYEHTSYNNIIQGYRETIACSLLNNLLNAMFSALSVQFHHFGSPHQFGSPLLSEIWIIRSNWILQNKLRHITKLTNNVPNIRYQREIRIFNADLKW